MAWEDLIAKAGLGLRKNLWADIAQYGDFRPLIKGDSTVGDTVYVVPSPTNELDTSASYLRIGPLVLIEGTVQWTSMTGTGDLVIGGLPFPADDKANRLGQFNLLFWDMAMPEGLVGNMLGIMAPAATEMVIGYTVDGSAPANYQVQNAGLIYFSGWYFTKFNPAS